jgi:uncharacterized membrane protein YjfL (UPF0719 family)
VDPASLLGGLIAYLLSALVAVGLVFVTYRINLRITDHIDEERLLLSGHRSIAVALGSVVLCQAILLRHAVFPCMVMVRDLFFRPFAAGELGLVALRCLLLFVVVGLLAVASVAGAAFLFSRLTRALPEREEILKDNLAVAVLFSFVLLGITLILNEGLADLARALVPLGGTGVLRLP